MEDLKEKKGDAGKTFCDRTAISITITLPHYICMYRPPNSAADIYSNFRTITTYKPTHSKHH